MKIILDKSGDGGDDFLTMNKIILMSLALAVPAIAGTETTTTYEAPPAQQDWKLTAGASAAYLFDYEEVLYTGNVGVKSPWSTFGWNVGFFLEGGFLEQDNDAAENALGLGDVDADLKIVPVTFNVKLEKALNNQWSVYAGGGAGYAHTEFSSTTLGGNYDSEWVFTGQAFAGVAYHINDQHEVYAGGRFIHFDDADDYNLNSDYAAELGYRFSF